MASIGLRIGRRNGTGQWTVSAAFQLDYSTFADDAREILRHLTPIEQEVASGGSWFLTRVRPYQTADERIEGVVATFIDITDRLAAEQNLWLLPLTAKSRR